jgi:hypothetical protein
MDARVDGKRGAAAGDEGGGLRGVAALRAWCDVAATPARTARPWVTPSCWAEFSSADARPGRLVVDAYTAAWVSAITPSAKPSARTGMAGARWVQYLVSTLRVQNRYGAAALRTAPAAATSAPAAPASTASPCSAYEG